MVLKTFEPKVSYDSLMGIRMNAFFVRCCRPRLRRREGHLCIDVLFSAECCSLSEMITHYHSCDRVGRVLERVPSRRPPRLTCLVYDVCGLLTDRV